VLIIPQLILVSIFPIFAVRSYFDSLRQYKGLDGLVWFSSQYPDDYAAILWVNQMLQSKNTGTQVPVVLEADGDSYTDFDRFSAFTGAPTIVGWAVHEWLWRGSYDIVSPRREDVRLIYESDDISLTQKLLKKYQVAYIVVGTQEREKFKNLQEAKIKQLGLAVFSHGNVVIYRIMQ
jgi:uncharacterized membrane protein